MYEVLVVDVIQRLQMRTTRVEAYFSMRLVDHERIEMDIVLGHVRVVDGL